MDAEKVEINRSGHFPVGAIVTRDGTDRHRVVSVNASGDLIEVECVVAPESGWTEIGIREHNVPWRYERASL